MSRLIILLLFVTQPGLLVYPFSILPTAPGCCSRTFRPQQQEKQQWLNAFCSGANGLDVHDSKAKAITALFMQTQATATQSVGQESRSNSTAATVSIPTLEETLQHKLVVLEDVVERLHLQKKSLLHDLQTKQSLVEELKANFSAAATASIDQNALDEEKKRHEEELHEMEQKLKEAQDKITLLHEENHGKFQKAKESAIAEHRRLQEKVEKLEDHLAKSQAKLDSYRKQSYERESKLRQSLRDLQETQRTLEILNEQAIREAEKAKSELAEQSGMVEERLTISEAAVAAAERRESKIRKSLELSQQQVKSLQFQLAEARAIPARAAQQYDQKDQEIEQLREQIESMHLKFDAERRRERQKWAREIDALQEALEMARTTPSPSAMHNERVTKPGILRRIGRKILRR